jgi:hypothetical protein
MTAVNSLPKVLSDAEMTAATEGQKISGYITVHAEPSSAEIAGDIKAWEEGQVLVAEKSDQATVDRMRFVEKGVPFMPTSLGTIATTAVKQLAETPVGIIKGGVEGAKAAIQRPKEIIPAMKEAYDYAASPEGQKDIVKAGYEDTKGLVLFLPQTLGKFIKNPQKQITEDPVGTIFLFSAIGGGAAKLANRKLRAKVPLKPEEINAVAQEIAPDQTKVIENTEKLKAIAAPEAPAVAPEPRAETRPIEGKAPIIEPIAEAPKQAELIFDIKRQPDGTIRVTVPEAPKPIAEAPQMPISSESKAVKPITEPKTIGGGYPPTGKTEEARLRGIEEDRARWEREHIGVRKFGSLETFMEIPIEETRASADIGVAEAKQALAERTKPMPEAPTVEIVPEFTKEQAEAKAAAEQKVKRDRVQGLPENLSISPEWKPEWDALIIPALEKAKIKPEHRANATLLLKHGFSMAKMKGTDVSKGMEHYLNTLKTRLKADERFPETQMPEAKTAEGTLEIEPTEAMAKGEAGPKGKNIIPEPSEVEAIAKRRERGLEAISKIVDEYEATITDAKEKEMFRTYREGKSGKEGERELKARGVKVSDDTLNKYIKKWEADLQEHGKSRKDTIKKMMDELAGDEFDKTTADLADKMDKDLGPVKGGKVGLTVEMQRPIPEPPKGGGKFAFPEKTEARYEAAKRLPKPTALHKANQFLTEVRHGITRTYPHLPVGAEFIEVKNALKRLEKQPGIVADKLYRTYRSIVYKLDTDQYDLMNRRAIVSDLLHEADAGHNLPFGFDEQSLREVAGKLDTFTKDNAIVNDALRARADLWESLRKQYVYWRGKVGHNVDDALTKPDYFRHKVIEHAGEGARRMGQGRRLRLHTGQEFLKKRAGSEMDILADLVSSDYEVMSRMLYDIEEAKTLSKIRGVSDKSAQFKAEATEKGVPIEEVIPKDYTKWQPKEGHAFYVADTLPAKIAEKILTDEVMSMGVVKDSLRKSLAMGRERETWIIKNELADTLDNLSSHKESSLLGKGFKSVNTKWKQWTLLSPRRVLKYNLRNLTGDADKAFVGNTHGFTKAPRAFKELFEVYFGDRPLKGELKEYADRGGLQTTLQVQEMGEIPKLPIFKNIYEQSKFGNLNIFKKYWNSVNKGTNFRESVLRYANYVDYLEQMQKDPRGKPKNFGASLPDEIMGLADFRDRAFRLSNELLGAYDEISPIGQTIREKIFPFWSWKELNTKSYIRMMKNIAYNDEAAVKTAKGLLGGAKMGAVVGTRTLLGAGRFAIKAFGLTALLSAYNEIFFKDEENDLPRDVQGRLHIVLGRDKDGKVQYFSRLGALGDFLEWAGLDAGYKTMNDYLDGRKTIKEIVVDMAKSPVNVVASGLSPFLKAPLEIATRKTLFPDAFDPKTIRDRGAYFARQLGVEDEYRAIAGKPGKPYLSTLSQIAIYKSDPLETAYYNFLDIKRDYLKSIGRGTGGAYLSPSSNALYNMKMAYRYGEHDKVKKYLQEYTNVVAMQHKGASAKEIGDLVRRGISQSFRMLHPLSGIKRDDWAGYVGSLDSEARETLAKALRFYNDILLGKSLVDEKEND